MRHDAVWNRLDAVTAGCTSFSRPFFRQQRLAACMTTDEVVDPVCGEAFPPHLAVFSSMKGDHKVFFCSSTCKGAYDKDPDAYPDLKSMDA